MIDKTIGAMTSWMIRISANPGLRDPWFIHGGTPPPRKKKGQHAMVALSERLP